MRVAPHPPAWVGRWIGIPYKADARPTSLEEAERTGWMCWSLVGLALKLQFANPIDDYDGPLFFKRRDARAVAEGANRFAARWRLINDGDEQAGDVIRLNMAGLPIHVGIVVAPGLMLHVEEGCDSVWERYRSQTWKGRIAAFHRAEPVI